ncbi:HupE/UreJ family protein [Novosphingobium sp.]|uniref:HupE/UreJ family protein n=1 Tax=Novosphingobium sp. TaxID=1874826 RepID=UPI003BA8B67A
MLRFALALLAILAPLATAAAHEVRPAFLEITERADGCADVLWKQPSMGMLVVPLRPRISGGLIDRPAGRVESAMNFEIRHWDGIDLGAQGLNGREVRIEGLDKTITDTLLLIHLRNGDEESRVLSPGEPATTIDAHAGAAVPAYLLLGIEHILTGVDHLLFVFGLLLLSSGWQQLLRTITAFTVAHSITLALTALKVMALNPGLVEAMVAWSILFLAVELVRKARGEDGLTLRQPWLVAFGFGLLHGAAFAGALHQIGLPQGNIPASLFLFNVGVEIGQLTFVGVVMAALWLLSRFKWPAAAPRLAWMAATYAIGSFSFFWFLERLHAVIDFA